MLALAIWYAVVGAILALWAFHSCEAGRTVAPSVNNTMLALSTNPAGFVKNRITGGIGIMLTMDTTVQLPRVMEVMAGSPADKAGLRREDVITLINGKTTTGQKLADVVEAIRGFSLGSVEITVLRDQTNRLDFTIGRNSMNSLLQRTNSAR